MCDGIVLTQATHTPERSINLREKKTKLLEDISIGDATMKVITKTLQLNIKVNPAQYSGSLNKGCFRVGVACVTMFMKQGLLCYHISPFSDR